MLGSWRSPIDWSVHEDLWVYEWFFWIMIMTILGNLCHDHNGNLPEGNHYYHIPNWRYLLFPFTIIIPNIYSHLRSFFSQWFFPMFYSIIIISQHPRDDSGRPLPRGAKLVPRSASGELKWQSWKNCRAGRDKNIGKHGNLIVTDSEYYSKW